MDGDLAPASELPPDAAALADLFAEKVDAAAGHWRIELYLEDGRLRKWSRQEEGGRQDLSRFDREKAD